MQNIVKNMALWVNRWIVVVSVELVQFCRVLVRPDLVRALRSTGLDGQIGVMAEGMIAARPELSLAQISSVLGYDHPASFTRAYRRWTGQNPSEDRRSHTVEPLA